MRPLARSQYLSWLEEEQDIIQAFARLFRERHGAALGSCKDRLEHTSEVKKRQSLAKLHGVRAKEDACVGLLHHSLRCFRHSGSPFWSALQGDGEARSCVQRSV
jgi:hypothetical protein